MTCAGRKVILSSGTNTERTRIVSKFMRNLSLRPPSPNNPRNRNRKSAEPASTQIVEKVFEEQTFAIPNITAKYSDLDRQRRRILLRLIAQHGGHVAALSDLAKSGETVATTVVVSEYIHKHALDRVLERAGVANHDKLAFVIPEFITSL